MNSLGSSYTACACRDCMDIACSSDATRPELCELCEEAGCAEYDRDIQDASVSECQRDNAYEGVF